MANKERSSDELTPDLELLRLEQGPSSWSAIPWTRLFWCSRFLRRRTRRQPLLISIIRYATLAAALLLLVPVLAPSYRSPPAHYRALEQRCRNSNLVAGCANPRGEKIFIGTILYDGDGHLTGGLWGERVLQLIQMIGPDNVFLSIYESDSGPAGRVALDAFKPRIPCAHSIVHEDRVSRADMHNVTFPDGNQRTKRIAFLSELRNRALRPLDRFSAEDGVAAFNKVLFLNDIAFHPVDAAQLLFSTNQGPDGVAHYLAACAVDWFHPLQFYDLYAMRDADGYESQQKIFPLFQGRGRGLSRVDMLAQKDAVRVKSCWGGMMAVQARHIQNMDADLPRLDFQAVNAHVINPDRPTNVTAPVRFRHEPELYYDACECCLFSADVAQVAARAGADETEIYMNPYVRVAYSESVLGWLPMVQRWERLFTLAFDVQARLMPATENPYRTVGEGEPFAEEVWAGDDWRLTERRGRSGLFCGVRETQVLRPERKRGFGWVNTKIPPHQTLPFRSWWGAPLPPSWRADYARSSPRERETFFEDDWLR